MQRGVSLDTMPWHMWCVLGALLVLVLVTASLYWYWRGRALEALAEKALAFRDAPTLRDSIQTATMLHIRQLLQNADAASVAKAQQQQQQQQGDTGDGEAAGTLEFPVAYSQADMAYVLPVRFGKSSAVLNLVLDSGSFCITVASKACVSSGQCRVPDARGYARAPSTAAATRGSTVELEYATISVTAEPTRDSLLLAPQQPHGNGLLSLPDMEFYTATRMTGTASHIAGLARRMSPQITCDSLLEGLFKALQAAHRSATGGQPANTWGLVSRSTSGRGRFWVGRRPRDLRSLDWVRLPLKVSTVIEGAYMVPVDALFTFRGTTATHDGAVASLPDSKCLLLLDTGTAETYFPPSLAAKLQNAGIAIGMNAQQRVQDRPGLGFRLGRVALEFPNYMVTAEGEALLPGTPTGRSTFHAYTQDVKDILEMEHAYGLPIVLFGIAHMQNAAWEFPWTATAGAMELALLPHGMEV
jgi:hypothetical protein